MRAKVREFVSLGRLPDENADAATIQCRETALHAIEKPVTVEEAQELSRCFGRDDCYGLAWTLLHIIESAPESPVKIEPNSSDLWLRRLWDRSHR